ncbi:DUF4157 domain-containing protein [Streptomyces sp. NPDC050504]|uniref:DUF4157 domain-containing protein n=1 Tax=Streptomyces sp. NPDC050504 TaxID=3365618 RepID=UPI0037B78263
MLTTHTHGTKQHGPREHGPGEHGGRPHEPAPAPTVHPAPYALVQRSLGGSYLQRLAECGGEEHEGGTCAGDCTGCGPGRAVQAKLTVGPAGDAYEQEADRIADRVAGPAAATGPAHEAPASAASASAAPASAASASAVPASAPPGGRPLAPETRAYMEPRFGRDFGDVRLHSGPDSHRAADRIGARAFTHGKDVHLGAGESERDHRLIAHELTHTLQQSGAATPSVRRAPKKPPTTAAPPKSKNPKPEKPERTERHEKDERHDGDAPHATDYASVTMEFDGRDLIVRGDGNEVLRYGAQSGKSKPVERKHAESCGGDPVLDSYMNDRRYMGIEDYGTIPEGRYTFSPPTIQRFSLGEQLSLLWAGILRQQNATIQGAPVHAGDWGSGRVALSPLGRLKDGPCGTEKGNSNQRSGFYLHGGSWSGSAGCIDIGWDFDELAAFLAGYRRPVVVTVEYRHPPPTLGFFTGLTGALAYGARLRHGPSLTLGAEFSPAGGRGLASLGYEGALEWAGGALAAGVRLDVPFSDREAFVRAGLSAGFDFRIFGPLYGRLRAGYSADLSGDARSRGFEAGGGLRLDLDRLQLEAVYNVLRPAAQDERVHQALVGLGFRF